MKQFTLFYTDGRSVLVDAINPEAAMTKSSNGSGAGRKLDFWCEGDVKSSYAWSAEDSKWIGIPTLHYKEAMLGELTS